MRVSVCHCLDCQKCTGGAFAFQARWSDAKVTLEGAAKEWLATGQTGGRATFRFCPVCRSNVCYDGDRLPGLTAVAVGAFTDPDFPPPDYSVWENRNDASVGISDDSIEHFD